MKKLLISALVAAMCLGFGASALAAASTVGPAFSDIAGTDAEFALTVLGALGIYSGDSGLGGAVKPDDPITRAQFCKVVVAAVGRSSTAAGLAGLQPTFTDGATIPTWAWGSVNVAVYMGIINGYGDGSFKPNNPVTYAEAVTMVIRAISGHAAQVGPGVWPYNFLFYGVDNGFTGGVDVGFANLPASRGDIAQMLLATMQINKLNAKGEVLEETAVLFGRVYKDVLAWVDLDDNDCTLGSLAAKVYVAGAKDLNGLMNVDTIAVTDAEGDIVAIGEDENASSVSGVFDKYVESTSSDANDYIVLKDGTKVPFTGDEDYSLNGETGYPGYWDLEGSDELVITLNAEGEAAYVMVTRFEDFDYVTEEGVTKSHKESDGTAVDTYVDGYYSSFAIPASCPVTVNGASAGRDTVADFDVFSVALNPATGDAFAFRGFRQVAEGTVASTSTTFSSGGSVEKVTIDLKAGGSKTYSINGDGFVDLPSKGDVVKYALDGDGKLFVVIGYESLTPYVVCASFVVNGDGTQSATFDVRGTSVTYKVDEGLNLVDYIGEYLALTVETSTNTVISFSLIDVGTDAYKVVAVDKTNGTMTLEGEGYEFVNDANTVIYKVTDEGDKVFVGFDGIDAGTWLLWNYSEPVFEVTTEPGA